MAPTRRVRNSAARPGPSFCHSKSKIYISDPAGNFQNCQLTRSSPALMLKGEIPLPHRRVTGGDVPLGHHALQGRPDSPERVVHPHRLRHAQPHPPQRCGTHRPAVMHPISLWKFGNSSSKVPLEQLCHRALTPTMTGSICVRSSNSAPIMVSGFKPPSLSVYWTLPSTRY